MTSAVTTPRVLCDHSLSGTAYSKPEYGDDGRTLLRRIQQQHLRGGGQLQNVVMVTDGDRVTVHEPESRVSPLAMEEPNSSLWSRRCAMSSSLKDRRWKSYSQIHGDGDWNGGECVHVDSVLFAVHLKIYEMRTISLYEGPCIDIKADLNPRSNPPYVSNG